VEIHHEEMNAVSFSAIGRGQSIYGVQIELIILCRRNAFGHLLDSGAKRPIGFVIRRLKRGEHRSKISGEACEQFVDSRYEQTPGAE
jgi:hypothetical protein